MCYQSRFDTSDCQQSSTAVRRQDAVRFTRRWGPHRIDAYLRMARSTVGAVLRRYRMPLLSDVDQASGLPVRRPRPYGYEHPKPGDLVHIDVKKLGRIPDGGGYRKVGRQAGRRNRSGIGYAHVHHAVDDHSRLAYSEILEDDGKDTAAGTSRRDDDQFGTAAPRRGVGEVTGLFAPRRPMVRISRLTIRSGRLIGRPLCCYRGWAHDSRHYASLLRLRTSSITLWQNHFHWRCVELR